MAATLERSFRAAGGRVLAALVARYRDLDVAEEALAEACARAAESWPRNGQPADPAAWLYRTAERAAIDAFRKRAVRDRIAPSPPEPDATPEDVVMDDARLIPDERLRLIFVCCHPAVAPDARAALTLRLVCGLSTGEIARAFLMSESTLAQRLVRAKRKVREAGIPYEVPGPSAWPDRLDAVLSTLEVAYSKAHEDAAGLGLHAGYGEEVLRLTRLLAELLPEEPEVLSLAALVRYAEARRPARLDGSGAMVPLSEQNPARWRRPLIEEGNLLFRRAAAMAPLGLRGLQAAIHGTWCSRISLDDPAPWRDVLQLYDAMLARRDDPLVRLNRIVALAEVAGTDRALAELSALDEATLGRFLPYHAARADLLRRSGLGAEAAAAYDAALSFDPTPAERLWLERRRASLPA